MPESMASRPYLPWTRALPRVPHAMQLICTEESQGELQFYLSQLGSNQVWVCRPVRMYLIPERHWP